jgi:hypothetical protein
MSTIKTISYMFRRPRFPLICEIDGCLIGAQSAAGFRRGLARFDLSRHREFGLIDANGERWMLLPNEMEMVLAPVFATRRLRKIEIIRLFNASRSAKEAGLRYPESRIPNTRLDAIVKDLAALLPRSWAPREQIGENRVAPVGDEK